MSSLCLCQGFLSTGVSKGYCCLVAFKFPKTLPSKSERLPKASVERHVPSPACDSLAIRPSEPCICRNPLEKRGHGDMSRYYLFAKVKHFKVDLASQLRRLMKVVRTRAGLVFKTLPVEMGRPKSKSPSWREALHFVKGIGQRQLSDILKPPHLRVALVRKFRFQKVAFSQATKGFGQGDYHLCTRSRGCLPKKI